MKTKELLARARKARYDFAEFCKFCFRDKDGKAWTKLGNHQEEWIDLILKNRGGTKKKRPEPKDLFKVNHLILWAPTESAKTETLTIGLPIWLLGRNPNLRIILGSNTAEQVTKFISAIAEHIQSNPRVKLVFPDLKPKPSRMVKSRAQKWTERHLMVDRTIISKDYSVSGYGVGGGILNTRAEVIILDDVLDLENTRSEALRRYVIKWIESTVLPRLTKDGLFLMVGTAWHPNDAMHYFEARKTFVTVKYSYDERDAADGYRIIKWDRYTKEDMENDLARLGPVEFARSKRCRPVQSEALTFQDFDSVLTPVEDRWEPPLKNLIVSIGVDVSSSSRPGNAIAVVGMDPSTLHKYLLEIRFGRWTGPARNEVILETFDRWESVGMRPVAIVVENNGVQEDVVRWLSDDRPDVFVIPFVTGKNKADPTYGLPALANEFYRGIWTIPQFVNHSMTCPCDWCRLVNEFREHPNYATSDGVMAVWFATKAFQPKRIRFRRTVYRQPRIIFLD